MKLAQILPDLSEIIEKGWINVDRHLPETKAGELWLNTQGQTYTIILTLKENNPWLTPLEVTEAIAKALEEKGWKENKTAITHGWPVNWHNNTIG